MNIKQFLKPDWRRLIIFVIIFGLLFLSPIIPHYFSTGPIGTDVRFYYWVSLYDSFPRYYGTLNEGIDYILFAIIMPLIISYILSCLIVWIYGRVKKKK